MPYLYKFLFENITTFYWQISAGKHVSLMTYEQHTKACKASARSTTMPGSAWNGTADMRFLFTGLIQALLPDNTFIVRATSYLHLQLAATVQSTYLKHLLLILLRQEHICFSQFLTAPNRNQHEYVHRYCT